MDRNRKILISILGLVALSLVLAIIDITMNIQDNQSPGSGTFALSAPKIGPGVGIVRIDNTIEFQEGSNPLGILSGAEAVIRRLDELEKDSRIEAVVVRINSPGGTVGATQEIYQKIWRLRKKNVPIVASMGEIAASGGYYIASACNVIYANHGTMTGSIGVIAMSPNMKRLFDRLGITMNVIKSGRYKDIMSSFRDISPQERAMLQDMIDSSYKKFLKDVALGRNMNQSEIAPFADGRIMNGEAALEAKLIDGIGTFEDSIMKARELAKLPEDAPVYDQFKTPFEQVMMTLENISGGLSLFSKGVDYGSHYRLEYRYMP